MNVFYSSLAFVTVFPVLLCSRTLRRRGKIALWTTWAFFFVVLVAQITLFLWANLESFLD